VKPPVPGSRKDRARQVFTFLGVAIILVSLPTIAVQQYEANQSQNDHHAATVKQDKLITTLERENLAKDTAIRNAQKVNQGTLNEITKLASVNEAICADILEVAASTGLKLTPCPTVTVK